MSAVCAHTCVHHRTIIPSTITLIREYSRYTNPDFFSFASLEMLCLVGVGNGLSALCDVAIVIALSYYLNSKRTGFKRCVLWVPRITS